MTVNDIELGRQYLPLVQQRNDETGIKPGGEKFSDTLKEFLGDVNSLQKDSAKQTERLLKGEPVDIHDVMISAEKAKTSFQLLMEIRNKALDLYREVQRMQA